MSLLAFTLFNFIVFIFSAYAGHDATRSSFLKHDWLNHQKETILDAANHISPIEIDKKLTLKFPFMYTCFGAIKCGIFAFIYGSIIAIIYELYCWIISKLTSQLLESHFDYNSAYFYGIISWLGFYYGRSSMCRYLCVQSYTSHPKESDIERSPRDTIARLHNQD